jgi:hypothetical protein
MFLTDTELFDLTGYRRNADRCRWLKENGWTFLRNAITGRPVVSRSYAESKLSGVPAKIEPKLNTASIRR